MHTPYRDVIELLSIRRQLVPGAWCLVAGRIRWVEAAGGWGSVDVLWGAGLHRSLRCFLCCAV